MLWVLTKSTRDKVQYVLHDGNRQLTIYPLFKLGRKGLAYVIILRPKFTWQYFSIPGDTWQYLSILLQYFPILNCTYQYLTIPNNTWQTWYQLVSPGIAKPSSIATKMIPVLSRYRHNTVLMVFFLSGIITLLILVIFAKPSMLT